MTQELYSIKEAAKELGVETHALRFWEDELELCIGRNAQGRRVYSEENMQDFRKIMEWKKQGLQLKAIKQLIHGEDGKKIAYLAESRGMNSGEECGQLELGAGEMTGHRIIVYKPKDGVLQDTGSGPSPADLERAEKARRLQELLKQFISESIRESNTELLQGMKEGLLKELDYQFRLQEEREVEREKIRIEKEDEHFRQLDENLRSAMEKRGRKRRWRS